MRPNETHVPASERGRARQPSPRRARALLPVSLAVLVGIALSLGGARATRADVAPPLASSTVIRPVDHVTWPQVLLGVRATGAGGIVTLDPTGDLDHCAGGRCYYRFPLGTRVTVTATATESWARFARWLEACSGGPQCLLTLDGPKLVTARFSPVQLYVPLVSEEGSVTVSPMGARCGDGCISYDYGTIVTLTEHAAQGYSADGWSGACASVTGDACRIRLWESASVVPDFTCTDPSCAGRTHQGLAGDVSTTVTVHGRGLVSVNGQKCGGSCHLWFARGQILVLRAYRQSSSFLGWSGSCRGTTQRCQLNAYQDPYGRPPSIDATFSP